MAKNKRAIKTYVVTSFDAIDDVANAAVGDHKVLDIFPLSPDSPSITKYGITVLHSSRYQIDDTYENEMLRAMNEADRNLPENQM